MPVMLLIIFSLYLFQSSIQAAPLSFSEINTTSPTVPSSKSRCTCPNQRSIWDILWSCIATIFSCSWVVVHPNIPTPGESWHKVTLHRLELMFWALVTPEMMIFWAMRQWLGARHLSRVWRRRGWTTTHGYFLQMGGFMLYDKKQPLGVLFPNKLQELYEQGKIEFPTITKEEIQDRSKADALAKITAIGQTTWFIVQCFARSMRGLDLTELELITAALAFLNGFMYFLWWNKPLDVKLPVPVYLLTIPKRDPGKTGLEDTVMPSVNVPIMRRSKLSSLRGSLFIVHSLSAVFLWVRHFTMRKGFLWTSWLMHAPVVALSRGVTLAAKRIGDMAKWPLAATRMQEGQMRVATFYAAPTVNQEFNKIRYFAVTSIIATVFGAIHWLGQSRLAFPSPLEMQLWKTSSAIITIIPLAIFSASLLVILSDYVHHIVASRLFRWLGAVLGVLTMLIFPLYVVARLILLVEALGSLRSLPPDALEIDVWTSIIPHI